MKAVIIGDIHGRTVWRQIVSDNPDADLFVFIGDYFDSFDVPIMDQIHNFREIVDFKRENPDKVKLLVGNHDFHYTSGCIGSYAGFEHSTYYNVFTELSSLIRNEIVIACVNIDNLLFTHAGVTKTWCDNYGLDINNIVQELNDYLIYKPMIFGFQHGEKYAPTGDAIYQSPLWVRPGSLEEDGLDYIHIVGHTSSKNIITNIKSTSKGYITVDTLESGEYLEIIIPEEGNIQFNSKFVN